MQVPINVGDPLKDVLKQLRNGGIVATESGFDRDVPGADGGIFYVVESSNAVYRLVITAARPQRDEEVVLYGLGIEKVYERKPLHILPGDETHFFESLTVGQIRLFQDRGIIPDGGITYANQ